VALCAKSGHGPHDDVAPLAHTRHQRRCVVESQALDRAVVSRHRACEHHLCAGRVGDVGRRPAHTRLGRVVASKPSLAQARGEVPCRALLGKKLVNRRNMGWPHNSAGTLDVICKLRELCYKTEMNETQLRECEDRAFQLRYTGSALFLGSTFAKV